MSTREEPQASAPSLLTHVAVAMTVIILLVFVAHGLHMYSGQKAELVEGIHQDTSESLERLSDNIAPFIEAYAVNEYEKLVATEAALKQHFAVIVKDARMGRILGIPHYESGRVQAESGEYVPYSADDSELEELIQQAYYADTAPILSRAGEVLGEVTVYASDDVLVAKLQHILFEALSMTVILGLSLSFLLIVVLRRYFVQSLKHMDSTIKNRDSEGIPLQPIPDFRYRELSSLSSTINAMLASIRESRERRKEAEEKLSMAAGVFRYAQEGIVITSAEGTILDVNSAFTALTGYRRSEAVDQFFAFLKADRHPPAFFGNVLKSLREEGVWTGECWIPRKGGDALPSLMTIAAVRGENGQAQHYVTLFADISVLKRNEDKLRNIAHYDSLTGLPNRFLLNDRLRQSLSHARRHDNWLAVVFMDLDGFKEVNDTYGHDAGDDLLVCLAQRMQENLRECDTVARIGGDEFVALLPELSGKTDCEPVLERLLAALSAPVAMGQEEVRVSASLGVTFYPQNPGVDADTLIRQADIAMYEAKQGGKNRYRFFTGPSREVFGNTAVTSLPDSDLPEARSEA